VTFTLKFEEEARAEWDKLDKSVREPLKKKLEKRLEHPHVENERLAGRLKHCYKIKHNKTGHRLIYQVIDDEVVVLVLAIDKRENLDAYLSAASRIKP
jgi:mRNA interferase RelE/StbE